MTIILQFVVPIIGGMMFGTWLGSMKVKWKYALPLIVLFSFAINILVRL